LHIVQIEISNFRCIKHTLFRPQKHNVFLAPNNSGKTAVLEALNLLLNPDLSAWSRVIDENDFYSREYLTPEAGTCPTILIEAVLTGLSEEDEEEFRHDLVAWDAGSNCVVDEAEEGEDPFTEREIAIRVAFEAFYDPEDDDFKWRSFFRRKADESRDDAPSFGKSHKRRIGFLIYRDIRALSRPTTLEPTTLFARLLQSQDVSTRNFEAVLDSIDACMAPTFQEPDFMSVLNSYKAELERFLVLDQFGRSALSFELTSRTRDELKEAAQLYSKPIDGVSLPIQKMGAGTRSLALLAILTLIMRRRKRGILALEEPETFLFPHAQRRVLHEALELADQVFVTTHSPYVLEQIPIEAIGKLERKQSGDIEYVQLTNGSSKTLKLYNKRLRQAFSEAMLGRAVVVVEGDSDKWWVDAAAQVLDGITDSGFTHEGFDLAGVTVVSSETHGDSIKTAQFFGSLNLPAIILLDKLDDPQVVANHEQSGVPTIFLRQAGIEKAIVQGLPLSLVAAFLSEAPLASGQNAKVHEIAGKTEPEQREMMFSLLKKNKGSRLTHEWIVDRLTLQTFPKPLIESVRLINKHLFAGQTITGAFFLIS
jgi:putative ATP-dependent endonuclease of OLD family